MQNLGLALPQSDCGMLFAPMLLQLLAWRSRLQIPFREPSFVSGLTSPEREPQGTARIGTAGDHSELGMCLSYRGQSWIPCQVLGLSGLF